MRTMVITLSFLHLLRSSFIKHQATNELYPIEIEEKTQKILKVEQNCKLGTAFILFKSLKAT